MTVIAAIVEDEKVYMGADSAGVGGWSLTQRQDRKVFGVGEFMIGFTTSFRMGQILQYHLDLSQNATKTHDALEYMVCAFIPEVKKVLKEHGYQKTSDNVDSGGCFLVGFRGELFKVDNDFQVGQALLPFQTCGCGGSIALGSLHSTNHFDLKPQGRILMALEAAETFSIGVRGPFYVRTQPKRKDK